MKAKREYGPAPIGGGALVFGIICLWMTAFLPVEPATATEAPQTIEGGLQRVSNSSFRLAYVLPGTNWKKYRTVQLYPLDISPEVRDAAPRGQRPRRARETFVLGDSEVANLQKGFDDAMRSVLGSAGYTFVDTPRDDTVVVVAKLTNIRLNAPIESSRFSGRSRVYSRGAGSMSMAAAIADGQTGRVIAQVADGRWPNSMWRINNRVTNTADARQIFNIWARALRDKLRS